MNNSPSLLSISEVAWVLGVEPDTVAQLVRFGTLRAVRRRGRLVIPSSALARLLREHTHHGQTSGGAR
ncbi:MAG TPA: helix-turn-helix domain-containing protein [Pseudonocardiaceae bacterium]|nr:helix-turn-helix domain-containing protein [Pseudonocardiaceae bacterium]